MIMDLKDFINENMHPLVAMVLPPFEHDVNHRFSLYALSVYSQVKL